MIDAGAVIRSRGVFRRYLFASALLFSFLFLGIVALVGWLSFRTLSEKVFTEVYAGSLAEAIGLADTILKQGGPGDPGFLRGTSLRTIVRTYVDNHLYLVDQVDRIVIRNAKGDVLTHFDVKNRRYAEQDPELLKRLNAALGGDPLYQIRNVLDEKKIEVRYPITMNDGQKAFIEVAPSEEIIREKLAGLRRELVWKLLLGAALSLILLAVALVFVLRLLNKTRRLEAEAQQADRLAYVGTLARGLAHEIRNPLNAMAMNLQMLETELKERADQGAPSDHVELLRETQKEVRRLERLVGEFTKYARPAEPDFKPHDLNRFLDGAVEFGKAGQDRRGVVVRTELQSGLPRVTMDEDLMRQALLNILNNAFHAVADGGQVTVRTRLAKASGAEIEIEDTGAGIPAEALARIFEVFFSTKRGGSGLGLPIARRIVELHGGSIGVDSLPGRGTRVRVLLPLQPPAPREISA